MLHKMTSKLVFTWPNSHFFPYFLVSSLPCMFIVRSSDILWQQNHGLLPKPFWFLEMHHTAKIIWHFVLRARALSWVESGSQTSNQCLKTVGVSKSVCVGHKNDMYLMKAWKHDVESGAAGNWAAMVMSFLVGSPFHIQPPNLMKNVQVKSFLGVSSPPFQVSSC